MFAVINRSTGDFPLWIIAFPIVLGLCAIYSMFEAWLKYKTMLATLYIAGTPLFPDDEPTKCNGCNMDAY